MRLHKNKFWKAYRFPLLLLISILIGSIIGMVFGKQANVLKPFGDIFLNLMYTIVVPLVFFTISSSIANMVNMKRLGKILKYLLLVFFITGAISALFMLIVVIFISPVTSASIPLEIGSEMANVNIGSQIVDALTVNDFSFLLSKSHMLPLIIFAIFFGISTSLIGKEGKIVANFLDSASKIMMKFIHLIMYYAPIGLCAYFANLIGEFGPELLGSYARSMILYYGVCIVYFFLFYTLYAYFSGKKKGVKRFFKHIFPPSLTSLATQSSLATLPSNLEATEKMGVPKDIREVTLPLGTTIHMEGSSMGSILKIVFLFGVFGIPFQGFDTYFIAIMIAVLSGVVMSGIPGGGLIGEMLIVSLYSFPPTAFPMIATIGWLIDPPATWINVTGDSAAAMMVTRLVEGKDHFNEY